MAHFQDTQFDNGGVFEEATVSGLADLSGNATFRDMQFQRARFLGDARFKGRNFSGIAVFRRTHFEQPPEFYGTQFPDDIDLEDATFGPITDINADRAQSAYRALKRRMNDLQHHRAEVEFFAHEMRAKTFTERNVFFNWLYRAYGRLSDYGRSVWIPARWLLTTIPVAFFMYALVSETPRAIECYPSCSFEPKRLESVAALAIFGLIPFFDFAKSAVSAAGSSLGLRPTNLLFLIVQLFQLLASLLFLFLIGVGLRNLFRLR